MDSVHAYWRHKIYSYLEDLFLFNLKKKKIILHIDKNRVKKKKKKKKQKIEAVGRERLGTTMVEGGERVQIYFL